MGNLISPSTGEGTISLTTRPNINDDLIQKIIDNQQKLITNIEIAKQQTRDSLSIDVNYRPPANSSTASETVSAARGTDVPEQPPLGNALEPFKNSVSDYYSQPFYLASTNTPELRDYATAYNDAILLLDDPNNLNKLQFDTYIHLQDKKIRELEQAINNFPTNSNIENNPIKAIKNLKTSKSLNVEEFKRPNASEMAGSLYAYRGNGAPNYPNYLIYGNNGCLEYNKGSNEPNKPTIPATWNFQACNANDPKQRFNMTKIQNKESYNGKINPNNKSYEIQTENNVIFNFYVVNPETEGKECLTLNNDGLSVMPCNLEPSQRFKGLYHNINP